MKRMLILHICTLFIADHFQKVVRSPIIFVLYPANNITMCVFGTNITNAFTARYMVYSFWAKLHEVIHLHTLQCIISLILTKWPCE